MTDPRNDTAGGAGEFLLKVGLAVFAVAGALAWAAGQLAGLLFGQDWLSVDAADMVEVLAKLPAHLDDPERAWPVEAQEELPGPVGMYLSLVLVAGLVLWLGSLGLYWWDQRHGRSRWWRRRRQHPHRRVDGATWARPRDLHGLTTRDPRQGRISLGRVGRLGRLLVAERGASVIVFGPPGFHKTVGVVDPAFEDWAGPAVGLSMKPDTLRTTLAARQRRGRVWVVDPTGLSGVKPELRVRWSPLAACGTWRDAQATAKRIAETDPRITRGDNDAFWVEQAKRLLAPLLYAASNTSGRMRDVLSWVNLRDSTPEQVEQDGACEVIKILEGLGNLDALEEFDAIQQQEPKLIDSTYVTAKHLLNVWTDERIVAFTDGHTLNWAEFLAGDNSLYLYAPLHEQTHLRPLFEVLLAELVEHAQILAASRTSGELPRPLLLALDEAANVAALANLPQLVATARGAGIHLLTVWHDYAQLKGRYGEHAATVFNGHRAKLLLPGIGDPELLRMASELAGERAYTEITRGYDPQQQRSHYSQTAVSYRPLLTIDALRQLPVHTAVLLYGNRKPARIHLRPSYTRTEQRRRARSDRRLARHARLCAWWQTTLTRLRAGLGDGRGLGLPAPQPLRELPAPRQTTAASPRPSGGGERP